jgi:hypothetical protein
VGSGSRGDHVSAGDVAVSLTAPDRETIISFSDAQDAAFIYTAQRTIITKLRKNVAAKLVEEGEHEGSVWARFKLPAALASFRSSTVRRELSEEQR